MEHTLEALVALGLRDSPGARGTMEAMVQLASMAAQEPYLLPQILPVFYHHLQREIDPMGPSAHITLAFTSLTSITQCLWHRPITDVAGIIPSIIAHWPFIWRWSSLVIEKGVDKVTGSQEEVASGNRKNIQMVMAHLFRKLASYSPVCDVMSTTPGVVATLTRLYRGAAQDEHPALPVASEALQLVMTNSNVHFGSSSIQEFLQVTMTTLDLQPSELVAVSMRLIKTAIYKPKIACAPLLGALITILNSSTDSPEFSRAYIADGSVSIMAYVFSRLTSYKPAFDLDITNFRLAVSCLKVCGQYLQRSFSSGGFSCVIEALNGRLLSSIMKSSHYAEYDLAQPNPIPPVHLETVLLELYNVIGSYSVYRSVLGPLEKSLRRIDNHSTEEHLDVVPSLSDSWTTLQAIVEERLESKFFWDADADVGFCSNEECLVPRNSVNMRRCGGCLMNFYCSKRCQRIHWPTHKSDCVFFYRRRRIGEPQGVDARDFAFMDYIIEQDTYDHRVDDVVAATMTADYIAKHPACKDAHLVLRFDYTCVPMKKTIITFDELIDEEPCEDLEKLRAEEALGEDLVLTVVPQDQTPVKRVMYA